MHPKHSPRENCAQSAAAESWKLRDSQLSIQTAQSVSHLCIWPMHEQCSLNMRLLPFLILCAVMGACMHTARSGKTTGGQCRICFNICQLFPSNVSAACARCTATQIIMHLACSYAVCVQWLELCMQRSAFLPAPARHRESLNGHACNQADAKSQGGGGQGW